MNPTHTFPADLAPLAVDEGVQTFLQEFVAPVQTALRRTLEGLPGGARSAGEAARRLKLDRSSVWRIWNAAYAPSLRAAALQLSGEAAVERFLTRTESIGGDRLLAERVRDAMARFEAAVQSQIGDRTALKLIVSPSLTHPDADAGAVRAQFEASRARLGMQAAVVHRAAVRSINTFGEFFDVVSFRGLGQFRTFHAERDFVVFEQRTLETPSGMTKPRPSSVLHEDLSGVVRPADGLPDDGQALPIMPEQSNLKGRTVYKRAAGDGAYQVIVRGGQSGRLGDSSLYFGEAFRSLGPSYASTSYWGLIDRVMVPTELFVIELYVSDAEWRQGLRPSPCIFESLRGLPSGGRLDAGEHASRLEHYAPARTRPLVSEIAGHDRVIARLEEETGEALGSFHLLRWCVKLPLVNLWYGLLAQRSSPA